LRFLDEELHRSLRAVLGDKAEVVRRHIVRGDPVKRLSALAQELGADVICLGSTGKGAIERVLLGSVSQRMVRTSDVPVLIVH
jgi:nucleotide-binding universal stress UspA family protein